MQAFRQVTGPAAPLLVANVDTDVIIRADLDSTSPEVLGPHAFGALRFKADGAEVPDFVLNREPFRHAPILLAGLNFGCGSSRERAVWALLGVGIRCVVAPSFGGIFEANCCQNGLLPVVLPEGTIRKLALETEAGALITVDLEKRELTSTTGTTLVFDVDEMRRQSLLHGRDDIEMTLLQLETIDQWQAKDRAERPWVWRTDR